MEPRILVPNALCRPCEGSGYVPRRPGQGLEPCPHCETFGFSAWIEVPFLHEVTKR